MQALCAVHDSHRGKKTDGAPQFRLIREEVEVREPTVIVTYDAVGHVAEKPGVAVDPDVEGATVHSAPDKRPEIETCSLPEAGIEVRTGR